MREHSYIANVDLTTTDYTVPTGYSITELRCKTGGIIKVDTTESTGKLLYASAYDIFKLQLKKIYKVGTDAGLITADLVVFGTKGPMGL